MRRGATWPARGLGVAMRRRDVLTGALASVGVVARPFGRRALAAAPPAEIRIGYQKSSILAVVREQGLVEKRFGAATPIRWYEFAFGPPLLEALDAGRVDYGYTGNAPPIFAQAARPDLRYVAALPGRGDNVAILTPDGSPLKAVHDLSGRKVAVGKGSSGHEYLLSALEAAGLPYSAIQPVYLAPADGLAAFARGAVDAWSIWDPYLAVAEVTRTVRPLPVDAARSRQDAFFLANAGFVERFPDLVRALNEDVAKAATWARSHRDEATLLYAKATGVDIRALDGAWRGRTSSCRP